MARPYGSASHQMVSNELTNNGNSINNDNNNQQHQDQQQRRLVTQQQNYLQSTYQIDARIKRHPELQPYVPSDRDRTLTVNNNCRGPPTNGGSSGCNSSGSSINGRINVNSRTGNRLRPQAINTTINSNAKSSTLSTSSNKQPKKCVSMTRLDQLAQPKKNFPRNNHAAAPSSSNVKLQVKVKEELKEEEEKRLKKEEELKKEKERQIQIEQDLKEETERQIKIEKELREEEERKLKLEEELKQEEERRQRAEEEQRAAARREQELRKEEERRIKLEEELKEVARREEEERQSRQKLVEDILSKFNNSSSLRESE